MPAAPTSQASPIDPAVIQRIRDLPDGKQFMLTVTGTCMTPAGILDGDIAILRRQDHAAPGQLVAAHYHTPSGAPRLALKRYHPSGGRVRLVAADPAVEPVELDGEQVHVLGVLVGIDGTTLLPADSEVGCPLHQRFLRPEVCATCAALATPRILAAARSCDVPRQAAAASPTVLSAADPDGPLGLYPHYAHLLSLLAARLLDQVTHASGTPTRQLVVDLDVLDASDPIDVYNALLQAGGAFTQNQQLRGYLDRLSGKHALTALTAAQMWELLSHACAALERHPDLSEQDRELLRVLAQMNELAETPIASVPEIGVELHEELDAARQIVAALDGLEQAKADSDPHHVSHCQQRLAEARNEYRELVSGHVHAPIGP